MKTQASVSGICPEAVIFNPEGTDVCTGWCPECRARLCCETYTEDFWKEVEKDGGPWWDLPQYQKVERRILLP